METLFFAFHRSHDVRKESHGTLCVDVGRDFFLSVIRDVFVILDSKPQRNIPVYQDLHAEVRGRGLQKALTLEMEWKTLNRGEKFRDGKCGCCN